MYFTTRLPILFLFSILLIPSSIAVFPEEDTFWEKDQLQPATDPPTGFCFGPVIVTDNNGSVFYLHEKGCWVSDFVDNSLEVFHSTDLSTYNSVFEGLSGQDFFFQMGYNSNHDEIYACAFQDTFSVSRWFIFFHANNGTISNGPNILSVGTNDSPGKTCGLGYTDDEGSYNTVRCRMNPFGVNITHTLHNSIDYFANRNAPSGGSLTDEFSAGSDETNACEGQVIIQPTNHQSTGNSTRWAYYARETGLVQQRGCTWRFNEEACLAYFEESFRRQPPDRILQGSFASTLYNEGILTALTVSSPETANDGLQFGLDEIYVDFIEWGAPSNVFSNLLRLSDAHNSESPYGKKTFGYNHALFRPCIYATDDIVLLAYEAHYLDNQTLRQRIIVHSSRDGGNSWFAPSVVADGGEITGGEPRLSSNGNCIGYDSSLNQVVIGYVVQGSDIDSDIGGAWIAHTNIDNLNITQTTIDRSLPLPEGTVGDGTQFMSVPLQPIADAWGVPLSSIQWLTGVIVVMVIIASIITVGILAVPIAGVLGVGWMFVSGLFPVWFVLLLGLIMSFSTARVFFGGES